MGIKNLGIMNEETLKEEVYMDIHANNKILKEEYLNKLNWFCLLCHTHPLYRIKYAYKAHKLKLLNTRQARHLGVKV